ncbi:hypothetical protein DSO57_1026820 [Entomophthora muscae]|uniref:Uncharacterized protein n=2 Tax=Entomophthora muscae TaxID=34485 RepID=A0ACC2UM02_9FUNG|nr:hypothetical protein DSO57_1013247 [Entomophthora muscae]KAJ9088073.1 hypothetical protein DSO57_1026820 [Entomophthora muscae]
MKLLGLFFGTTFASNFLLTCGHGSEDIASNKEELWNLCRAQSIPLARNGCLFYSENACLDHLGFCEGLGDAFCS